MMRSGQYKYSPTSWLPSQVPTLGRILFAQTSPRAMKLLAVCSLLSAAALVQAAPRSTAHKVKETINVPRGWTKREAAPSHRTIELRIALPQPNFATLEKHLYEVRFVHVVTWDVTTRL